MNNKITKKRLSDFFSYEWIIMTVVIVVAIFLWEMLFSAIAVKPTTGQNFKYYIDKNIVCPRNDTFKSGLISQKTFSYDVLEVEDEVLGRGGADVLSVRLSASEGDGIITLDEKDAEFNRAKTIVDLFSVYAFDDLLFDAQDYLSSFLKDEHLGKTTEEKRALAVNYDNLDQAKIDRRFNSRMKGDNRFRKDDEIAQGKILERERIKKLCGETADFIKVLLINSQNFFTYTKYEQVYQNAIGNTDKQIFKDFYEGEIADGRQNKAYGIYLSTLPTSSSKEKVTSYFSYNNSADGILLMAFNFKSEQPDLQFECISFINYTVRLFSTVLD